MLYYRAIRLSLALILDTLFICLFAGLVCHPEVVRAQTWQATTFPTGSEITHIVFDPGTTYIYVATTAGVYRSLDTAVSWSSINSGLASTNAYSIAVDSAGTLLVGTAGAGVFRSTDQGLAWSDANSGLTSLYVWDLQVNASGHIYAATQAVPGSGLYVSTNNGLSWAHTSLSFTGTNTVAFNDSGHIFVGSDWDTTGIFRSTDDGLSWTRQISGLSGVTVWSIGFTSAGHIYVGSNGLGIHRSTDNGDTWTSTGATGLRIHWLITNANDYMYAGTFGGGVRRRHASGGSWTAVNSGLSNLNVVSLAMLPGGRLLAGTSLGGLFISCPDGDQDAVCDGTDNCPDDVNNNQADQDGDLVGNVCDNCPTLSNAGQSNQDSDTLGDICDNCPQVANEAQSDIDLDAVGDVCDNCPDAFNPLQEDSNFNGMGDACEFPESLQVVALASLTQPPGARQPALPLIVSAPVLLFVTDPQQDSITPVANTILNGSTYDSLSDYNSDLKRDEVVTIPLPITGTYRIRLERKPGTNDGDMFTLALRIDGNQLRVLDDYENQAVAGIGTQFSDTAGFVLGADTDGDGVADYLDNCVLAPNPGQEDGDGDGVGNACDVGDTLQYIILASSSQSFPSAPVQLIVRDPHGAVLAPFINTMQNGSTYDSLGDFNNDSRRDEIVTIPRPIVGQYRPRIVAKEGYPDTAMFTLTIRIDGNQMYAPVEYQNVTVAALGSPSVPDTVSYCIPSTKPGNCDGTGLLPTSADIIVFVNHVFKGAPPPNPTLICDSNCSGTNTSADIILLVNYVFKGGPKPCAMSTCGP